MRIISIASAFIVTIVSAGCGFSGERINGSGHVSSENRSAHNIEKIKSLGDIDVYVTSGAAGIKVEADDNILPYIITESDGEWLTIRTKNNINLNTKSPVKVYVSTPNISSLEVTGSGNITCNDKFSSTNNMSFKIIGSGDMIANVNAPKIHTEIAGSGNMHLKGETRDVDIHIAGSGDYDGAGLKAENADVSIAGSGNANLFAEAKLKASVAGSGDVKYGGNATVETHIAGSGSVVKVP